MYTFILRRLVSMPLTLIGVCIVTFVLLRAAPGDFFQQMEMDQAYSWADVLSSKRSAGLIKEISPEQRDAWGEFEAVGHRWQFRGDELLKDGQPTPVAHAATTLKRFRQGSVEYYCDETGAMFRKVGGIEGFFLWIGRAARLDFGKSFQMRRDVFGLIRERLTNTLILSICALIFAWGLAIPLGVMAAVKPNSLVDYICGLIAYFGLSIPLMFFALLAVLFATYTQWFPIGDMRDVVNHDSLSAWGKLKDYAHHLVLPTIVIGTHTMAGYMRQARGNMIEALSQDYVRTAKAKGVAPTQVRYKHALRNAINPLVTLFGYSLAYLLTGSFFVEYVMNWPGMARLVVDAIFAKDEPVVMAAVLVGSLMLMLGNLVADLLLAMVDPRVRLS